MGAQSRLYYCSRCAGVAFRTRVELDDHKINHPESEPDKHYCPFCSWPFPDALALEKHCITSGHGLLPFSCDSCRSRFLFEAALEQHLRSCLTGMRVVCSTCGQNFANDAAYNKHRRFPAPCSDGLKPRRKQGESWAKNTTGSTGPLTLPGDKNNENSKFVNTDQLKLSSKQNDKNDGTSSTHPLVAPGKKKKKKKKKKNKTATADPFTSPGKNNNNDKGSNVDPSARFPATNTPHKSKAAPSHQEEREMPYSPVPSTEGGRVCTVCKENFSSQAQYSRHILHCSSVNGSQYGTDVVKAEPAPFRPKKIPVGKLHRQQDKSLAKGSLPSMLDALHIAPAVQSPVTGRAARDKLVDKHVDDSKTLRSTSHRLDQKESYVPKTTLGAQHAKHGLPKPSTGPKSNHAPSFASRATLKRASKPVIAPTKNVIPGTTAGKLPVASNLPPAMGITPPQNSQLYTGLSDFDLANTICRHILRLRLQSNITIQHGGTVTCNGLKWVRVSVVKHAEVTKMLEGFIHLPPKIQSTEYLPMPKTFKDDARGHCPLVDFIPTPDASLGSLRLAAVAIACSKIVVGDGRREVVKIAAVDVLTCRVLMAYLIYTDLEVEVEDWQTPVTGLSGVEDIEAARKAGFRVLKGWQAARSALWKFVDKKTIIVGHNLRDDLDALRMIHGRGIDIIKTVEKAAGGPLFRGQLSLENMCQEYMEVQLPKPTKAGRDCLQDAFAIRQFSLWILKHEDELQKKAKLQAKEYQRFNLAQT